MMTYKETLFFVGKCLTITHEVHNRILVEEELKSGKVDWDSVVKLSTSHYVFPALYCKLKRADFLHYLPNDLVEYMKHITDLNRERNQQIIEQAKEINNLLLANNITPIFLKGAGNLLEGLYEDIGERMVGDIDFLVSNEKYSKVIKILIKDGYYIKADNSEIHTHFPRSVKKGEIAAIEIHNKILKDPYKNLLSYESLKKSEVNFNNFIMPSYKKQLEITVLQKVINDGLYYSKKISLRTIYDCYLYTSKDNSKTRIKNKSINKKFNNYLNCIYLVLGPKTKLNLNKYQKSFLRNLDGCSKTEKIKIVIQDTILQNKSRITLLKMAFTNDVYKKHVFEKIKSIEFYKKILGIKPKPNS